jgi:membrane protease YdiL (CAAX protease family)
MKRLGKFIRSVIPAEPAQLLILAGAICLTVSPHLRFLPFEFGPAGGRHAELLIEQTVSLTILLCLLVMFSGMAAYFVCFWPGSHAVRRILLSILAPGIAGSGLILAQIFWFARPATSILQSTHHIAQNAKSLDWAGWVSLPGFFFCFAGLVLVAAYTSRLTFGIARLPLSLPDSPSREATDSDAWRRVQWVVWVLIGPLILVSVVLGFLTTGPSLIFWSRMPVYAQSIWFNRLSTVAEGAAALGVLLWIMGKENRQVIWSMTRLPEPWHAALGLAFPIGIAGLIAAAQYLLARAQWAAQGFGREVRPDLGSFFNLPDPWLCLLILPAFFEEMIFRGLLQRHFVKRYGIHRGIVLVGIVWAAFHFHSDVSFSWATIIGTLTILGSRVAMCLVINYVLGWLTLRFSSVIPAALAHAFYNVLVFSELGPPFPGKNALRLGLWAILAWVLFRYWPVHTEQGPVQESASATPSPEFAI